MPIHFKPLPDLYDPLLGRTVSDLRQMGARMVVYDLRQRSGGRARAKAAEQLAAYAKDYEPYLSEDADFDRAVSGYMDRLVKFRSGA